MCTGKWDCNNKPELRISWALIPYSSSGSIVPAAAAFSQSAFAASFFSESLMYSESRKASSSLSSLSADCQQEPRVETLPLDGGTRRLKDGVVRPSWLSDCPTICRLDQAGAAVAAFRLKFPDLCSRITCISIIKNQNINKLKKKYKINVQYVNYS